MIALFLAVLLAFANGATDVRTGATGGRLDDRVAVEFVAPRCPVWTDEPCYVIVAPDWSIDVGP